MNPVEQRAESPQGQTFGSTIREYWQRSNRPLATVLGVLVVVGAVLSLTPAVRSPRVMVGITAHAVTFTAADTVDLVGHARPRFGLLDSTLAWSGLPLDSTGIGALLRWSTGQKDTSGNVFAPVLQSLDIDNGCLVTIETRSARRVQLTVRRSATTACAFHLAMLYSRDSVAPPSATGDRGKRVPGSSTTGNTSSRRAAMTRDSLVPRIAVEMSDTIPHTRSMNLLIVADKPLQWRRLPVRRLAFETSEFGVQRSAVQNGEIHLPDYSSKSQTVQSGDSVRLDNLTGDDTDLPGDLLELSVDGSVRVIFRGRAPRPFVANHNLRPSTSEEIRAQEWFIFVAGVIVTLIGALLPHVKK